MSRSVHVCGEAAGKPLRRTDRYPICELLEVLHVDSVHVVFLDVFTIIAYASIFVSYMFLGISYIFLRFSYISPGRNLLKQHRVVLDLVLVLILVPGPGPGLQYKSWIACWTSWSRCA